MVCDSHLKVGGIFSSLIVFVALIYHRYSNYNNTDLSAEIPNILDSLRRAEQKV